MATSFIPEFLDSSKVQYQCTCGQFKTIHYIYFCRYCNEIRCRDCVSHEVDSQFCQQCLEYIPSLDAKLKKNKCAQCYQCPSCHNILLPRVLYQPVVPSTAQPQQPTTQQTMKKSSFFYCHFCRWSSRDIGMPDQSPSAGNLPEIKTPNSERLKSLFEYYRILSTKDKKEKEKKRSNPRNAMCLLDKYGITSSLSAKVTATLRARMARSSSGMSLSDMKSFPELDAFKSAISIGEENIDQFEKLNLDDYYHDDLDEIDVCEKNSLGKIIHQVESQPLYCKDLFPISQMLVVKRSLRCKKCEHNLSKPEYNPSLAKFKIQLSAYYHIPQIRLVKLPNLKVGTTTRVELTITNPIQYMVNVTLLPVDIHQNSMADVVLPNTVLQLTPKDDTGDIVGDFDSGLTQSAKFTDDPNVVAFRHGNKLGIYLYVTPLKKIEDAADCIIEFRLKHDYVYTLLPIPAIPTSPATTPTEPISGDKSTLKQDVKWISHYMRLNLGPIE